MDVDLVVQTFDDPVNFSKRMQSRTVIFVYSILEFVCETNSYCLSNQSTKQSEIPGQMSFFFFLVCG